MPLVKKISSFSVYLKCSDQKTANILRCHGNMIKVMTYSSQVTIVEGQDVPEGCAMQTVSNKCETHLMLKVCVLCCHGDMIKVMTYSSQVTIIEGQDVPEGCAMQTVSNKFVYCVVMATW